ncbi:MAG TPA: polyprenol phosphomannose-dependent alpha 1,6 mannosyltransferase MptB, partial [Solirubrobacteraceae bacterium]|nr:polyprenol phosphomannose-dependent alpha 1,6 mannosyltransferase MptB [Solirubrobacteraceae bacterium]
MSVHGPLGVTDSGTVEIRAPGVGARTSSRREPLGLLGLGGLMLTTLLVAVGAAHTNVLLPESVRPVPSWLAGPFGSSGIGLGSGGVIVILIVMFASYAVAVRAAERLSARTVVMAIAAMYALVLLAPPLLSTDVFSYQFYGRMGSLYGASPYLAGPHALALDPLFPYIGAKWAYTPTVYGPLFTGLSELLAPLSIAASALVYKAIAAGAGLGTVALVWHSARLRGIDPVKAVALVGLNPLVVVYGVGGGHNDLLMMFGVMAGVYMILAHRERSGSAMIVTAAAVKLTAGVMFAFALASGGGRRARDHRRDVLIGGAAAAVLLAGLAFEWFGTGPLHLVSTIQKVQGKGDWHSIPGFVAAEFGVSDGHLAGMILEVILVGVCLVLLRRVWRGTLDWIDAGAWTAVALLVTAGSLLPWYVAWLMPLAALATDRRLWRVALIT